MRNHCISPPRALKFGSSPNNADTGIFCFITGHSQYTCEVHTLRSAIKMPKQKVSTASRLRQYVTQFGENVFSTDVTILFCKVCEVKVTAVKRFTVQQHIGREKHLRALENVKKRKVSQLLLKKLFPHLVESHLCFSKNCVKCLLVQISR